jgi:hypothetical protein
MWPGDAVWRPVVLVGGVCLILATQIFFQARIIRLRVSTDTLVAFAEYFGEIALIGFAILFAVNRVDRRGPSPGLARSSSARGRGVARRVVRGVSAGSLLRYGHGHSRRSSTRSAEAMAGSAWAAS